MFKNLNISMIDGEGMPPHPVKKIKHSTSNHRRFLMELVEESTVSVTTKCSQKISGTAQITTLPDIDDLNKNIDVFLRVDLSPTECCGTSQSATSYSGGAKIYGNRALMLHNEWIVTLP